MLLPRGEQCQPQEQALVLQQQARGTLPRQRCPSPWQPGGLPCGGGRSAILGPARHARTLLLLAQAPPAVVAGLRRPQCRAWEADVILGKVPSRGSGSQGACQAQLQQQQESKEQHGGGVGGGAAGGSSLQEKQPVRR